MTRKMYLDESSIQRFEHFDASQVAVSVFQNNLQRGAEQFVILLRSYRLAANVAVSAWKLVEELQTTGQIRPETFDELRQRLHLYAPAQQAFQPFRPVKEYTCRLLEELYDHLSTWDAPHFNTGIMLEQLYKRIDDLRYDLASGKPDG